MSIENQPLSRLHWVHRERLRANDWNPNHQAPPEHSLLKTSIIENGWTQPIVYRLGAGGEDDMEIVDGYNRWLISADPAVYALTDGLVPVVPFPAYDNDTDARLATVRHNRARGTHGVIGMANIVAALLEAGMEPDEIGRRLGMDAEEVDRLAMRGEMVSRGSRPDGSFGAGWTV